MCVCVVLSGDLSIFFKKKLFTNINLVLSVDTNYILKTLVCV